MTQDDAKPQLPQRGYWAVIGIFIIMLLGVMTVAQGLIVPIVTAMVLALTFSPVRRFLGRAGFPDALSAGIIILTIVISLGAIGYFSSGALQKRLDQAPDFFSELTGRLDDVSETLDPMMEAGDELEALSKKESSDVVVVREPGIMSAAATATPRFFGQAVLCLTLAFFLLASGDMFYEKLVQVMPTLKDKKRSLAIAKDIENNLSTYLLTITVINALLGVAVGLAMWALGMPDPLLFGVGAFLFNFVPYIGALAGVAITFAVALVSFDTTAAAIWPAAIYWALTSFEGQFITPVMVGRRLRLNAVVVFVSFAVWAWLWSFMGMLLSTPMLLALKVYADHVPGMEGLGKFLADRDRLSRSDHLIMKYVFRKPIERTPKQAAEPAVAAQEA